MTTLDVFTYSDQRVRTILVDSDPWFVAADVAAILGYSATAAMTRSLDDDEKGVQILHTPGGEQSFTVISEPGLYEAILRSRIPAAQEFKRWVKHDVLPSIRKTGRYGSDVAMLAALPSSELLLMAAEAAKKAEAATAELAAVRPKVEAYDALMDADGHYSMEAAAKILGVGRNTMFRRLREVGVLQSSNLPYQRHSQHFVVTASTYTTPDGSTHTTYTTRVRASGLDYLRRRLQIGSVTA